MLAGLAILVLALARPQAVVSVPRVEGTVILSFDVSGSMAADDMDPTRMEAAKAAALEVRGAPADVGPDRGRRVQRQRLLDPGPDERPDIGDRRDQPPRPGARDVDRARDPDVADDDRDGRRRPERGLLLQPVAGADAGPDARPDGTYVPAAIVLLTDGENNQSPDPIEAAGAAADRGVRIFTVGVGSAAGTTLEVEGFKVHSRLDEPTLRQISEITDGAYFAADDPAELSAIYEGLDTRLVIRPEEMEVTSLFAGAGVLLLLVGGIASLAWLGRLP